MPDRSSPPSPAAPSVTFHEPGIVRLRYGSPRRGKAPLVRGGGRAAPGRGGPRRAPRRPHGPRHRRAAPGGRRGVLARARPGRDGAPGGRPGPGPLRGLERPARGAPADRRGRALLRLRREDRAARQARPVDGDVEHRRVRPRARGLAAGRGPALPVDPVLRRPARRRRPTALFTDDTRRLTLRHGRPGAGRLPDRLGRRRGRPVPHRRPDDAPTCSGATPGSPGACRCRRAGRSATTSRAGATRPTRRCSRSAASFARAASPPTGSGSTSSTWTASAPSPGTRSTSPTRASSWATLGRARLQDRSSSSIPRIKVDPAWDVYAEALRDGHLLSRGDGARTWARSGPARRSSPTSPPRGARLVGRLVARAVDAGVRGLWIDMNEPSNFGGGLAAHRARRPAGARRRRPRRPWPRPHNAVRPARGAGHLRGACARRRRTGARSCSPAPGTRASSATPRSGPATRRAAGTPAADAVPCS